MWKKKDTQIVDPFANIDFKILEQSDKELREASYLLREQAIEVSAEIKKAGAQEFSNKLYSFSQHLADGVIITNQVGIIQFVNTAIEDMFGYKSSKLLGEKVTVLMPETYAKKHDVYYHRYFEQGHSLTKKQLCGRELKGKKKGGEIFEIEISVSAMTRQDESKIFAAVIRDISQRKKDELKRNHDYEFFKSIFDSSLTGVSVTDQKGFFVDVNKTICKLYGYSKKDLIGSHFTMLVPHGNKKHSTETYNRLFETDDSNQQYWTVVKKNGKEIDLLATGHTITTLSGEKVRVTNVVSVDMLQKSIDKVHRKKNS